MKRFLFVTLLLATSAPSSAHEIWIERDGGGPRVSISASLQSRCPPAAIPNLRT